jgi:hypothetical protein
MCVLDEVTSTPLCEIMSRYGSDKGSVNSDSRYNYTIFIMVYLTFNLQASKRLEIGFIFITIHCKENKLKFDHISLCEMSGSRRCATLYKFSRSSLNKDDLENYG